MTSITYNPHIDTVMMLERGELLLRVRNLDSEQQLRRMEQQAENGANALAAAAFANMGILLAGINESARKARQAAQVAQQGYQAVAGVGGARGVLLRYGERGAFLLAALCSVRVLLGWLAMRRNKE
jgi:hypothetical protein